MDANRLIVCLLVENARQLKEGSGVVVDGDGQIVSE